MKIIITGSEGFIGTNLLKKLSKNNFIEVLGIDIKKQNFFSNNYFFVKGDISDKNKLDLLFSKINPNDKYIIIHLAAQTSAQISMENPCLDLRLNLYGLINLIDYLEKLSNQPSLFIFSSSMAVYGSAKLASDGFSEGQTLKPSSVYGYTKLTCERLLNMSGIKNLNLRLFNIYGPGQDFSNKKQGMVSIYMESLIKKNIINIKGSLERTRDQVYIDDLINFLLNLVNNIESYFTIFSSNSLTLNFCSGIPTTVDKLTDIILNLYEKKTGLKGSKSLEESTLGDMKFSFGNINLLNHYFKNINFTKIEDGISFTLDWALENE